MRDIHIDPSVKSYPRALSESAPSIIGRLITTELHNLYSSPSIIRMIKSRRMRWTGHVERMGEKRNACRILVRKPEGKRPLGRPRRKGVNKIKMDFRETG
jgi:hypothetical protein